MSILGLPNLGEERRATHLGDKFRKMKRDSTLDALAGRRKYADGRGSKVMTAFVLPGRLPEANLVLLDMSLCRTDVLSNVT